MSSQGRLLLSLFSLLLLACSAAATPIAPAPGVLAAPPAAPPPIDAADTDPGDPGPVPVSAADPTWGNRDAPVTIVEFADFECPFSAKVELTLGKLKQVYGPDRLRIVWKNNPLPFHSSARPAAAVALMIFQRLGNDGFWPAHDALFAEQSRLSNAAADLSARAGIHPREGAEEGARQVVEAKIDADLALGRQLGVSGTPDFYINGVRLGGAQPYDAFATIVDDQIQKAKARLAAGTPPRRLYVELTQEARANAPPPGTAQALKKSVDDLAIHRVPVGKSPVQGSVAALVTMVEFADFQCPFSARVEPTLKQLQSLYGEKLRLVFKHNPLPFHPRAEPAAELAIEARAQKGDAAFWKVHEALFADQQHLTDADLKALATSVGLDAARAMKAIEGHKHRAVIDADSDVADETQANGTPHFFINGRRLIGAQPLDKFKAVIDEELQKAEALVNSGTPAAKVYDKTQAAAVSPPPPEKKAVPAPTKDNPSRGSANAKVTVQFFGDFQCPFCKRVAPTIAELEKAFPGKLRVVWRNLPLPMHKDAPLAAEAAMEAFRQKGDAGFWAMFGLLFAGQEQPGGLERRSLEGSAAQIGLDPAKFAHALDTRSNLPQVEADARIGNGAGLTGTPAFIINGYYISGAQPLSRFRKVVQLALAEAK
jgi:protein-disulfide isomerase